MEHNLVCSIRVFKCKVTFVLSDNCTTQTAPIIRYKKKRDGVCPSPNTMNALNNDYSIKQSNDHDFMNTLIHVQYTYHTVCQLTRPPLGQ